MIFCGGFRRRIDEGCFLQRFRNSCGLFAKSCLFRGFRLSCRFFSKGRLLDWFALWALLSLVPKETWSLGEALDCTWLALALETCAWLACVLCGLAIELLAFIFPEGSLRSSSRWKLKPSTLLLSYLGFLSCLSETQLFLVPAWSKEECRGSPR